MTVDEIIEFVEGFRNLHSNHTQKQSKLISLKVEQNLLNTFKAHAKLRGQKYQTRIKELMKQDISSDSCGRQSPD